MTTPHEAEALSLADAIAQRLATITGVEAVTLGGSYARGTARPGSDLDLGIYYRGSSGFDHAALVALAHELDLRPNAMDPTQPGEWGPRINGGAWLQIGGRDVDWLYRDVETVDAAIERALRGDVTLEHQPGHPAGFHSQIPLAEVALARPLHDPGGTVAALRARITPYPEPLRESVLATLWEAPFAVRVARKAAETADPFAVAGGLFAGTATLVFVLHALNRAWLMNEKGGARAIDVLPARPPEFSRRVSAAFADLWPDPVRLHAALDVLDALASETQRLIESAQGR